MSGADKEKALNGWLEEIVRSGWQAVSIDAAAFAGGMDRYELLVVLGDQWAAIDALLTEVAAQAADGSTDGITVRECLFDGLMQGFDALQDRRPSVLAIWRGRDLRLRLFVLRRLPLHLRRIALAAGMDVDGLRGRARLMALGAILWRVFAVWRRDDSADMSMTMAELDRLLDKAEAAARDGLSPDLFGLPALSAFWPGAAVDSPRDADPA